jgi:hypothetical protein
VPWVWRDGDATAHLRDLCPGCGGPLEPVSDLSERVGLRSLRARPRSAGRALPDRSGRIAAEICETIPRHDAERRRRADASRRPPASVIARAALARSLGSSRHLAHERRRHAKPADLVNRAFDLLERATCRRASTPSQEPSDRMRAMAHAASATAMTSFPRACPASRWRMASAACCSGKVLSMTGVRWPASMSWTSRSRSV